MTGNKWITLALFLELVAYSVQAEEIQWRPATKNPSTQLTAHSMLKPSVTLGKPIPLVEQNKGNPAQITSVPEDQNPQTSFVPFSNKIGQVEQTSYQAKPKSEDQEDYPNGMIIRAQAPGAPGVPPVPPPPFPGGGGGPGPLGEDDYNCANVIKGQPAGVAGIWGNITQPTGGRKLFESDHCFDTFISPVTNPLLFEDPRALTELRPVFIYQQTPTGNPIFRGGDIAHFSLQGRLALTDWLSITIHQLGWTWMEPHNPTGDFAAHAGFSELHIGPKWTFLRLDNKGKGFFGQTLMAAGLVFEIPIGARDVLQDTGSLSLRPYLSFGQQFGDNPYGRFHFLATTGYSFGVDSDRSDHLFFSAHLDFDVGKMGKIYPFVEMNYFLYTADGNARNLDFEGRDLFNFGSTNVAGNNDLSLAFGARYKFTEMIQLGGAFEFPLLSHRDLMDFRLVFDIIFRY